MSRTYHLLPDQSFEIVQVPTHPQFVDISGCRFGLLTVAGYAGRQGHNRRWAVVCDCGKRLYVLGSNLARGNTQSCGCLHSERTRASRTTHGLGSSAEYTIHQSMIARCKRPNANNRHFERGITVCERWLNGDGERGGFECFYKDMGPRPSRRHSIDRKDNDGHYTPDNCRWATYEEQQANTTRTRYVEYHGQRMKLREAADLAGINFETVLTRLKRGWSEKDALERPRR